MNLKKALWAANVLFIFCFVFCGAGFAQGKAPKNYKDAVLAQDILKMNEFYDAEKAKDQLKLINKDNIDDTTTLIYAVSKNNLEIAEWVISKGANVDEVAKPGFLRSKRYEYTALKEAIYRRNSPMVKFLLEKGADVNFKGKTDETPFTDTILARQYDIANLFFESGKLNRDSYNQGFTTAVFRVIETAPVEVIEEILLDIAQKCVSKGADVNALFNDDDLGGVTLLAYAAYNQSMDIVEFLIKNRANIDALSRNGQPAITYTKGNYQITKALIDAGADVNLREPDGWTPIMYAVEGGTETLELLISSGANINAAANDGESALSRACFWNNLDAVEFLIANGADYRRSKNIFINSIHPHDTILLEYLLGIGVDPRLSLDYHEALIEAAKLNNFQAFQLLARRTAAGVDIPRLTLEAAENGSAQFLLGLINYYKMNPNVSYADGQTALMLAALGESYDSVRVLIEAGADIFAKDKKGKTAYNYANNTKIKDYIKQNMKLQESANVESAKPQVLTREENKPAPKSGGRREGMMKKR